MKLGPTPIKILGLPFVINNEMEPGKVFCLEDSQTGKLALHCRRATYEKVLCTPELRALVATMVAQIKQALVNKRRDAFWTN